ncbi:MAG TPA: rhomboid family intramembrane serine protease, partial [Solirubrobacterales bacterium]|nr:rhomboid family intramembrane serine protease [Solirubrobacterales bacterium]
MAQTCYRHPNRETGVSCSSCGRPICPDCMTPTPVGMRCPECMRQRTKVTHGAAAFGGSVRAPATFVLIAINVAVYLAEIASGPGGLGTPGVTLVNDYSLIGTSVAGGEWYRLLTGAFLHAGLTHIAFNMVALYFLGRLLEPAIGTTRFVFVYFASLFAGSLGALLLSGPDQLTLGASGAIFGIFGAAFVIARGRGLDSVARTIGVILLFNLAISLGDPQISLGGHL